jgi:hypothetical protein
MTRSNLTGRLERLEQITTRDSRLPNCAGCGLEHARPITVFEFRFLLQHAEGVSAPPPDTVRPGPFCLCSCCGELRGVAELTHGHWAASG